MIFFLGGGAMTVKKVLTSCSYVMQRTASNTIMNQILQTINMAILLVAFRPPFSANFRKSRCAFNISQRYFTHCRLVTRDPGLVV